MPEFSLKVGAALGATVATVFGLRYLQQQRKNASKPLYFDYNATTPIATEVADAMEPYLREHFGNPSSSYAYGQAAKKGLDTARKQVADLIGAQTSEIIFTSGATESINTALKQFAESTRASSGRNEIITVATEHPAVLEVCAFLGARGYTVKVLPVDSMGLLSAEALSAALSHRTALVSVMLANNEVGTVHDIKQLVQACKGRDQDIIFHCDASQGVGKLEVDVRDLGVDLLTIAGHKIYAPKGIGALFMSSQLTDRMALSPLLLGGSQEQHRRAGTENVLLAVGLGAACHIIAREGKAQRAHMSDMRDTLLTEIKARLLALAPLQRIRVNGHPTKRLPNTLSIGFEHVPAHTVLSKIRPHVAASAGAACHSGEVKLSSVLRALRVPAEFAMGTLRLSVGVHTDHQQVRACAGHVVRAVVSTLAELQQSSSS